MHTNTNASNNATKLLKKAKSGISKIQAMTLRKLNQFKQSGKCLAVSSYALGEGVFHSFVEDIYVSEKDEIVVLKWYDQNNSASLTHVFLEEILSIAPADKNVRYAR